MKKEKVLSLGDRVCFEQEQSAELQIVSFSEDNMICTCIIVAGNHDDLGKTSCHKIKELHFLRKASLGELEILLDIAVEDEEYALAAKYKKIIAAFSCKN